MDHLVREVQRNFVQGEIRVLDLLGTHDVAVAIIAGERSASVGTYGQLPDLTFLGGDGLVVGLSDRNFVQEPMCATVLGDVLHAFGVENVAVDPVPIPVLAPRKLREVALAESLLRHNVTSFLHVIP
jgi:hypothetical protein